MTAVLEMVTVVGAASTTNSIGAALAYSGARAALLGDMA